MAGRVDMDDDGVPADTSQVLDRVYRKLPESVSRPRNVTGAMLDEAADIALKGVVPEVSYATRKLWAMDPNTVPAGAYFHSQLEARGTSKFATAAKQYYTVRPHLSEDEIRKISLAYPEFELRFAQEFPHDHAMAAASRAIDQRLLISQVPVKMRYKDIGGNVMSHVEAADTNCVTIGKALDAKDSSRVGWTKLRLRKLASGAAVARGEDVSREMARSIISGEGRYHVWADAREDTTPAAVAIMCHVYDIPLQDIPGIMERGGTHVLEGCLHFSSRFLDLKEGVMDTINGRFNIDPVSDTFSMGFVGSSADWYHHRWSDFVRYGADQVLEGDVYKFSYKVRERRGDTIFFRVLRVGPKTQAEHLQFYDTPGIPMVEVDGFDFVQPSVKYSNKPARRVWNFPADLWQTLLREATVKISRGGLDYNSLVDIYRTAVVPHQLNGVRISKSERVELDLVVPLVVHAGICAYTDHVLLEREIEFSRALEMAKRARESESTLWKTFRGFIDGMVGAGTFLCEPIKRLADLLSGGRHDQVLEWLVNWRPVPKYKKMKASMFLSKSSEHIFLGPSQLPYEQHMRDRMGFDDLYQVTKNPSAATEVLEVAGEFLPPEVANKLRESVVGSQPSTTATLVEDSPASACGPDASSLDIAEAKALALKNCIVKRHKVANRDHVRLEAIREAIQEIEFETTKIEHDCGKYFRRLMSNGTPDKAKMKRLAESLLFPEFWWVSNGVLVSSSGGSSASDGFSHAAVYCPRQDDETGSHIRAVRESEAYVTDEAGEAKLNLVIRDSTYTGWVMTNDSTKIFNGPDILGTLRRALDVSHDYDVVAHQGGPGAGKTTQIVKGFSEGDAVLCPVRQSTDDTRAKLLEAGLVGVSSAKHVARTIDSLLVNFERIPVEHRSYHTVHIDEMYMAHSGKVYAALGLLGATLVHGYGDVKQIPHVPRVDAPSLHVRVRPDLEVEHLEVYRCARAIMALWAGVYDYRLRTPLKEEGKVVRHVTYEGLDFSGETALLVMYQAEKKTLEQMYPKMRSRIMTVHESEGKTFDKVFLFNFEMRKRDNDVTYLFAKENYCDVACSRARHEFHYIKKSKEPDLVVKWLEHANDPRRIAAVGDMSTIGQSIPYLN